MMEIVSLLHYRGKETPRNPHLAIPYEEDHSPVSSLTCLSFGASSGEHSLPYFPFQVCLCLGMRKGTVFFIGISSVSSPFISPQDSWFMYQPNASYSGPDCGLEGPPERDRGKWPGKRGWGPGNRENRHSLVISYRFPARWEAKSTRNTHPHSARSMYVAFSPCVSIWGRSCRPWGCQQMPWEEAGTLPGPQRAARHSFQLRAQ